MQNTPDWGSCMVWDGESEYMRMSTKVVAINMGQVLGKARAFQGLDQASLGLPHITQGLA